MAIDITGNTKKHSYKSEDRSYIHSGSIGGMSIGHNYSVIGKKEDGGWMLPVAIDRVPHSDNKFDFSVIQAESVLDKVPEGDTSIIVGDSAYSCNKFIHNLSKRENVAVITRMRANKAIYEKYEDKKEGSGRKRKYGKKYLLNKPDSLPDPDYVEEFEKTTKKGLVLKIRLSLFKGYICRGSKDYAMSDIPINFIRAEVFKENGEKKYDRDLWIGVAGKARDKVTTMNGFKEYADRFDLEQFFKFSKSKLLMDKMQSSDPKKDEDFMLMTGVAYHVLCKSADLLDEINIRPWENKKTIKALLVNTKNANTFTGKKGYDAIDAVAKSLAKNLTLRESKKEEGITETVKIKDLIFASTGVIGETFPEEQITNRISDLVSKLRDDQNKLIWIKTASAIMTTDTKPKLAYEEFTFNNKIYVLQL